MGVKNKINRKQALGLDLEGSESKTVESSEKECKAGLFDQGYNKKLVISGLPYWIFADKEQMMKSLDF